MHKIITSTESEAYYGDEQRIYDAEEVEAEGKPSGGYHSHVVGRSLHILMMFEHTSED